MNRYEATEQYKNALKLGKKYYSACMAAGEDPYLAVYDQVSAGHSVVGQVELGLIDIPTDLITGTWGEGRKLAFAGNFMPLLEPDTEFGLKWINLCSAHLSEEGITDPILCYEYLGQFYVREGHKRVSVLKSYGSPVIQGRVTRILPKKTEELPIALYYEFLDLYKLSGLYTLRFNRPGSSKKMQAALGFAPDHVWTDDEQRAVRSLLLRIKNCLTRLNASEQLPVTDAEALLIALQVHPFSEMRNSTDEQLKTALTRLWPDIRLYAIGEPISVTTAPAGAEKNIISRILSPVLRPHLNIAFIYDWDPKTSSWAAAHAQGQAYLEETLGKAVTINDWLCQDESAYTVMSKAISSGANVLFATTPALIGACRKVAAENKGMHIYNCSLSLPYAGVQSYYCRIYEVEFIAGAIAAAMSETDDIGYIANYPIMGVPAAINAFSFGAQLTRPRVRVHLKWSCLPGDTVSELEREGIRVISNRDSGGPPTEGGWDLGTYCINENGKRQLLVSPLWNWGRLYERIIQSLLQGTGETSRDEQRAITNWWGLSAGVVDLKLAETLPDSLHFLAETLKRDLAEERVHPFDRRIVDQKGQLITEGTQSLTPEDLLEIDWLNENIVGHIPAFEELQERSRNLVRLLGIYRDSIPPEPAGETP